MGDHQAKAALYDALAEAAKALANGRRAELIDVLAQGERSVEELAAEIEQSVANTSQHLQRLLKAGLVTSRRDGTRIYYSLASPVVGMLWRSGRRPSFMLRSWTVSHRTIWGTGASSTPLPGTSCGLGYGKAMWSCSTYARSRSSPLATPAVRSPCHPRI
jgi:DNA-binding transcriptional ArsR family regulator